MKTNEQIADEQGLSKTTCRQCGHVTDITLRIKEKVIEAIRQARAEWEKEGCLNLVREMMNANKTPFWIKVLPEKIDTTPEHMFSFAEEYSKMKVEKALTDRNAEILKAIELEKKYIAQPRGQTRRAYIEVELLKQKLNLTEKEE